MGSCCRVSHKESLHKVISSFPPRGNSLLFCGLSQLNEVSVISSSIGSPTSTRRLCDLSSAGKFGRGGPHNLQVDVVDPAFTTDITSKSSK